MSPAVTILGSTGSIGLSALRVLRSLGGEFRVHGITCNRNLSLLEEQVREFRPSVAAIGAEVLAATGRFRALRKEFPETEFFEGDAGIMEVASRPVDILISAIVGAAGLRPSIAAVSSAKRIALANKETLVMAGPVFMDAVRSSGTELLPVDSEHSALFFLLEHMPLSDVRRLVLTASGGSLRDYTEESMRTVTPEEVLAHPTWSMGSKITVDSATLMNKGLEVIEAHHLFGIDYDRIGVVIHPESIIHSLVETTDGALHAYMSRPDMAHPILNAITYPQKRENSFAHLDLGSLGSLSFREYDRSRFPALGLCYEAGRTGGTMPAVMNAANEIGVDSFLKGTIRFTDIFHVVERTMAAHQVCRNPVIDDIFLADRWAREQAIREIRGV